jgi:hypothetical protein
MRCRRSFTDSLLAERKEVGAAESSEVLGNPEFRFRYRRDRESSTDSPQLRHQIIDTNVGGKVPCFSESDHVQWHTLLLHLRIRTQIRI